MAFTRDEAKLVAIFIQTLLYGAFVVLFAITCWVLLRGRPKGQPVRKSMLVVSILMFVLATMHIGVNYTRIYRAFITYRNAPGGPAAFFNQRSEFTQMFGSTLYVMQTLVGDSVVLLRCYIVCGRQIYVIAFPLLLLLGSTAAGIGILYSFARVVPNAEIFAIELQKWIVSFFSMTLATNIICTSIVAYRIWVINRESIRYAETSLRPIMLLVIESGAIYSATLTILIILYKVESWFQYVIVDAVSPIVGLVFSMIIIRIGLGLTTPSGETNFGGSSATQTTTSFNIRHTAKTEPVAVGFLSAPKSHPDESMASSRGTVFFDEQADKETILPR